jgi:hypothetical protein
MLPKSQNNDLSNIRLSDNYKKFVLETLELQMKATEHVLKFAIGMSLLEENDGDEDDRPQL